MVDGAACPHQKNGNMCHLCKQFMATHIPLYVRRHDDRTKYMHGDGPIGWTQEAVVYVPWEIQHGYMTKHTQI